MLYILEEFVEDMRFYQAGTVLKDPDGPARAFALHIWGIRYSRMHLTDGFLPFASAHACGLVQTPQDVAEALCSRTVKLWKRVRGGYLITTYKDNNPTASRIKKLRAAARLRKQEERERKKRESQGVSHRDTKPSRRRERAANEQGTCSQLATNVQPMCGEKGASDAVHPHKRLINAGMSQRDTSVTGGVTRTQYPTPSTSTQSTQLELLPPVLVHPYVNTKAPALSRRPVEELLKTPEAEDVATSTADEGPDLRTALRDRAGADRSGADDRRLRVEAPDQGSAPAAALRPAAQQRHDPSGDERRAAGSREAVWPTAGAGAGAAEAGTAPGAAVAAADARGSQDGLSEGQRQLQATIARLREQIADAAAGDDRRRNLRLAAPGRESDGGADRRVEGAESATTMESDTEGLGPARRGVAR